MSVAEVTPAMVKAGSRAWRIFRDTALPGGVGYQSDDMVKAIYVAMAGARVSEDLLAGATWAEFGEVGFDEMVLTRRG